MPAERARRDSQAAYLLHTYPYRETSLVAEFYTRDLGRVAVIARGARRPRDGQRVAQRKRRSGAGGGCEIERPGLVAHRGVEVGIGQRR